METRVKPNVIVAILVLIDCALLFFAFGIKVHGAYPVQDYPDNRCLGFDGTDDYVTVGYDEIFELDYITIEMWIKPEYDVKAGSESDYGTNQGMLLSRRSPGSLNGYDIDFTYTTGLLYFRFCTGSYTGQYHTDKSLWYNTTWHHIAITYNRTLPSGNLKFYINGTIDSQHDDTRTLSHHDEPLQLGCLGGSWAFGGIMDEVRIWNTSRTQSEIQNTMFRTLNDTERTDTNLVGYWRFDDGSGTYCQDYSNYENDAVLASDPRTPEWTDCDTPIIPEFPSLIILPLLMAATLLAALAYRRKRLI